MQRYFLPAENWKESEAVITGDDVHHITRVMRCKAGDKVICNHPDGRAAICRITDLCDTKVTILAVEWLEESKELPVNVTIAQGLAKGDKFDFVLQKGTELGAASFIPFQAERSVVIWDKKKQEKKMSRFRKIVKEASEQCHRNLIPEIKPMMDTAALLKESYQYDCLIFAYEDEAKSRDYQSFADVLENVKPNQHILVCIGPEGGFSEKEAAVLKENNFLPVRLGPRILRTETAAMYVLASVSYQFEELGCT